MTFTPSIGIKRSGERMKTEIDWLDSRHSFSFGRHYDPANTHFGLLLVSNDDVSQPDTGFSTHPHRDMEIVTWVLEGELELLVVDEAVVVDVDLVERRPQVAHVHDEPLEVHEVETNPAVTAHRFDKSCEKN